MPIHVCGTRDTVVATLTADFERGWSLPDTCAAAIQTTSGQVQTIGIRQVPLAEPFTPALTKACEAMGIHGEDGLGGRERV